MFRGGNHGNPQGISGIAQPGVKQQELTDANRAALQLIKDKDYHIVRKYYILRGARRVGIKVLRCHSYYYYKLLRITLQPFLFVSCL